VTSYDVALALSRGGSGRKAETRGPAARRRLQAPGVGAPVPAHTRQVYVRVRMGTPVHYEQAVRLSCRGSCCTAREEDAASYKRQARVCAEWPRRRSRLNGAVHRLHNPYYRGSSRRRHPHCYPYD